MSPSWKLLLLELTPFATPPLLNGCSSNKDDEFVTPLVRW